LYYKVADGSVPALEFLYACPGEIDAEFAAVLDAVAAAPPPQFAGGGKWEAMHGTMAGWHEIRLTGPGREQFRLFCLLENADDEELMRGGLRKPAITVITGMRKPWRTKVSERDYGRCDSSGRSTGATVHAGSGRSDAAGASSRISLSQRARIRATGRRVGAW
jgi:hypothetical protein